jgi:adenylate kinase family enzyme
MRVAVVGGSRAGKTTLSRRSHTCSGCRTSSSTRFTTTRTGTRRRPSCRGSASRRLDRSDLVVFLDPPFPIVLRRALSRTFVRALLRRELWNGNRETFRTAFSSDGIPRWVLRTHRSRQTATAERLAGDAVVRLCSRREIERFVQSIQATATMSGSSNGSELQNTPPLRET